MVSPNPPIRPTYGPFQLELVEAYPQREAALTERLGKLMDFFLHTAAFGLDGDGRPVRHSLLLTSSTKIPQARLHPPPLPPFSLAVSSRLWS